MNYLIKNATLVNEGQTFEASVFVSDGKIAKIVREGETFDSGSAMVIDARGKYLNGLQLKSLTPQANT